MRVFAMPTSFLEDTGTQLAEESYALSTAANQVLWRYMIPREYIEAFSGIAVTFIWLSALREKRSDPRSSQSLKIWSLVAIIVWNLGLVPLFVWYSIMLSASRLPWDWDSKAGLLLFIGLIAIPDILYAKLVFKKRNSSLIASPE